ncbi:hypothetical protein V8C42DRAFT_286087 [Trichoderma barbatum]
MSFTAGIWDYPSPSSITPPMTACASSTSVTSPSSSPPDSSFQVQSRPLSSESTPRFSISTPPGTVDPADITTTSARSNKKKKALMPVHQGPLREEDDWTKVKDPKEKKRIQNRVAQRTYRHRMKARLGELQARLDSHERSKTQQTTQDSIDSSTSSGPVRGFTAINQMSGVESSPPPMPHDKAPISQSQLQPPAMYERPSNLGELMFQHMPRNTLSSPSQGQSSPEANGLLSPPGHPLSERVSKVPHDFVLDCLRFQTQLLNRLNSLQNEANFTPSYAPNNAVPPQRELQPRTTKAAYGEATWTDWDAALDNVAQAEQAPCVDAFSPAHTDTMEFSFDSSGDGWKTDAMSKSRPPAASDNSMTFPALTAATTPSAALGSPTAESSNQTLRPVTQSATQAAVGDHISDRIGSIMENVQAAGFDSFDALVSAYYCDTFGEASPLANEQRLSRNRRLPKVIDDVFRATKGWSTWERRGFQEEILKTAESMLISEGASARSSVMAKIAPLLDSYDTTNPEATAEALVNLKRSIQDELPNSWALTMALASGTRNSFQRDRSNTALATTLLVNFSGQMPKDQLLQIVGACL